jgi:hypothetical protein
MRNYSQINQVKLKDKDSVINNAIQLSGLKREYILPLYESFSYQVDGDVDEIDKLFFEYFNVKKPVDVDEFTADINDYMQDIGEKSFEPEERRKLSDRLLNLIKKYVKKFDCLSILEILAFALYLKNPKHGDSLINNIDFGKQLKMLFESNDDFNFKKMNAINFKPTNFSSINKLNAEEDIRFYSSLKHLLNDIFKGYNNYHIDDIHNIIKEYLDCEINELTNICNVQSVDDSQYEKFIKDVITLPTINAMYYNPDYLKTITADTQTLLLDLALIVHEYFKMMSKFNSYIDQEKIYKYNTISTTLLESIYTSVYSSYLLNNLKLQCCSDAIDVEKSNTMSAKSVKDVLFHRLYLEDEYSIGFYNWNRIATDCILIIKGIQNEFPIKIRKILNIYISYCLELIHSYKFIETKTKNITINI